MSAILSIIWEIYSAVGDTPPDRKKKVAKYADKLGVKVGVKDMQASEPKAQVQALMSAWLPLYVAVM